jgi:predicted Rossmann fold nucleotide-binding protein DprA/Smf involved in DNA uptake
VTRSPDSLATILLVGRIAADGHQTLKASEFWSLPADPGTFLGRSAADLVGDGLDPDLADRIVVLLDRAVALAFELDRYEESGIRTLTPHDKGYPTRLRERLGNRAPAVLHVAGDPALLAGPSVGIVGSREVSDDGAEVAVSIARRTVQGGRSVLSGAAWGVDHLAMNEAWDSGGRMVGVLADSLTRVLRQTDVRSGIMNGSTAMVTPYDPEAQFSVGNAMGRNKIVYALSSLTVVVAADEDSGGSWAGATEALRSGFGRVAVWRGTGEGPGNAALEARGARRVSTVADLDAVLAEPDIAAPVEVVAPPIQDSLFLD